jgi:hypothetical protein
MLLFLESDLVLLLRLCTNQTIWGLKSVLPELKRNTQSRDKLYSCNYY